jgi:hypothetical protein
MEVFRPTMLLQERLFEENPFVFSSFKVPDSNHGCCKVSSRGTASHAADRGSPLSFSLNILSASSNWSGMAKFKHGIPGSPLSATLTNAYPLAQTSPSRRLLPLKGKCEVTSTGDAVMVNDRREVSSPASRFEQALSHFRPSVINGSAYLIRTTRTLRQADLEPHYPSSSTFCAPKTLGYPSTAVVSASKT